MHESLVKLAEGLVSHGMRGRRELLEASVRRREAEAKRRDEQTLRFYAQTQEIACVSELHDRADIIWQSYVRVIGEAGAAWTGEARDLILGRITRDMELEAPALDQLLGDVLAGSHSFTTPVQRARDSVFERVGLELDLFALRYQPTPSPLGEQLSAPRYRAARIHWEKSNAFLVAAPPDLENAVKEAVSMVEAIGKLVANEPDSTLGKCISSLRTANRLSPVLANSLTALWAESNQEPGVRHAHNDKAPLAEPNARYLVSAAHAGATLLLELDRSAT